MKTLEELTADVKTVEAVYVPVAALGGHYLRVNRYEFLNMLADMQLHAKRQPHPTRFDYQIELDALWITATAGP